MTTLADAYDLAARSYAAGHLEAARSICVRILQQLPDQPDVLHLLAVLEQRAGRTDHAIALAQRAIALEPNAASYWLTLALAYKQAGRLDKAIDAGERCLTLDPNLPEALSNYCNALREAGRAGEAVAFGRRAVALAPDFGPAHTNLAAALRAAGQLEAAMPHYRRAVELQPNCAAALNNLGNALVASGDCRGAIDAYQRAIAIEPGLIGAHLGLAEALRQAGQPDQAMHVLTQAAALDPADARARLALVNFMRDQGMVRLVEAAVEGLRQIVAADPNHDEARRALLFTLNYLPDADPQQVFEEHRAWGERHTPEAPPAQPRDASPSRLRIAYVSPDFKNHAVSYFLLPVLEHHDKSAFEVYCYAEVDKPDAVTQRYRNAADVWRSTVGLSDRAVAELIRRDRIDVLIDVAGHTAGNRLAALSCKPAPVQITWLGYPNTTGLRAFDYRITDAVADPPDNSTPHVETLLRLPHASVYQPSADAPPVNALPALTSTSATQAVTFGSLSNPAKINHRVIALWCRVLAAVPSSKLLLARETFCGPFLEEVQANFARHGVHRDRLIVRAHRNDARSARPILTYHDIDISLDTFPYAGHTTVCESLWMGVPVVTLMGRALAGRMGASVLTQAGLTDWIARDEDQYVQIAARLASDLPALAHTRATLRDRAAASPLCDAAAFTRSLEQACRQVWAQRSNIDSR